MLFSFLIFNIDDWKGSPPVATSGFRLRYLRGDENNVVIIWVSSLFLTLNFSFTCVLIAIELKVKFSKELRCFIPKF